MTNENILSEGITSDAEVVETEPTLTMAEVAELIDKKLSEQKQTHNAELDRVRKEAMRQVRSVKGEATSEDVVERYRQQSQKDSLDRESLRQLFGATSNGTEAAKLKKSDPVGYRSLRQRAVDLSILPGVKSHDR